MSEVVVLDGPHEVARLNGVEPKGRVVAGAGLPVTIAARPPQADFIIEDRHAAVVRPVRGGLDSAGRHIELLIVAAEFAEQDVDKPLAIRGNSAAAQPPLSVEAGPQADPVKADPRGGVFLSGGAAEDADLFKVLA